MSLFLSRFLQTKIFVRFLLDSWSVAILFAVANFEEKVRSCTSLNALKAFELVFFLSLKTFFKSFMRAAFSCGVLVMVYCIFLELTLYCINYKTVKFFYIYKF